MRWSRSTRRHRLALAGPVLALTAAAAIPGVAVAHELDNPPRTFTPAGPPDPGVLTGGRPGAEYQLLTTIPTGNAMTDLDFFENNGETYASVGALGSGLNGGGQTIVQLTEGGKAEPEPGKPAARFAGAHPSAACVSNPSAALGLQHDVEATPKAPDVLTGDGYLPADPAKTGDAQLLIDASDASGRCHDQGTAGVSGAPNGGLEVIDISGLGAEDFGTEANRTRELALTSHIGESHTVNVDPQRPNIAYAATSDAVGVTKNADGTFTRANEVPGSTSESLDGFEVVDLASCLTAPYGRMKEGLTLEQKRDACRPQVYRYRYPTVEMALGHTQQSTVYGCHELQMYPDDRLTCGSGTAAILFDMSGAFEEQPDGIDKPRGTPLPCFRRPTTTQDPTLKTGAMITDCVNGGPDGSQSLVVSQWLQDGAPSLEGVRYVGSINHAGRAAATGFTATRPASEDIDFDHESEFTQSKRFLLSTDERGGGVTGGAQCSQENSTPGFANGGVSAQRVDALSTAGPSIARTDASYALDAAGNKSIYRAPIKTGAEGSFCTAHLMQQIPGQNRIVMAWYSQGTQVVDYVELPGSSLQFIQTAYGIPTNSDQWVSQIFSTERAEDGRLVYYGATGDTIGGRNAIDIYKLTLPDPLTPCDIQKGTGALAGPSRVTDRGAAAPVHQEAVDCVLNYGISKGKTADTYAPTDTVTRGQMASFVARTLVASRADDAVLPAAGSDAFSDISGSPHRTAINQLAAAGIVDGVGGGRFDPEAPVSRAQMATFVVEAARFINKDRTYAARRSDYFADVPAGSAHAANIAAGFEAGLFRGTTEPGAAPGSGAFSPQRTVPRDQMASFLVRLFESSVL